MCAVGQRSRQCCDKVFGDDNHNDTDPVPVKVTISQPYIPADADYTEVDAAIAKAEALDRDLYTEDSLKAVDDAVAAVVRGLNEYEQAEVDAMAKAIEDAIDALVRKEADYTAVNEAVAEAEALDRELYTEESLKAVDDAVAAVEYGLPGSEQEKVDAMAKAIQDAMNALELKPVVVPADYSAVEAALATIPEDLSIYTEESVKALEDAVASVDYYKTAEEQAEVDAMAKAIEDAVAGLELKPVVIPADYSAVEAAIATIPEDLSVYTEESVKVLTDALAKVDYTKTAEEQAEVDAMAKAIEDAVAGLVLKPVVLEGWYLIEGDWYYFKDNVAQKGWLFDKAWFYLDPTTGAMHTGWLLYDNAWYFLDRMTGAMRTGWVYDDGYYYLFNSSGKMLTGWVKLGDLWYFLKGNGVMAAKEWIDGYYLGNTGAWTYNAIGQWKQDSKGWWFGDTNGWYARGEVVTIQYVDYRFNAFGYWEQ